MSEGQPREQRNEGQGTFVNGNLHGGVWNIFVNDGSQKEKQPTSAQEMLALGSVEAPFGRLPEAVLGRDSMLTALTRPMEDPRIQVLSGMGGVGKTTVALSAAERAKQAGAEIFWIQAGSSAAVADGMRHAALLAGASAEHVAHAWEKGGRPAADLVWRHLANMDRPWLLVFDDADDLDVLSCPGAALGDGTGWVRPPLGMSHGVLVTTRDGDKRSWGDKIARFHQLDVLETKFAGQVLQELAPQAGGTDSAWSLADRLGSLPLALHLAGTYLAMAHGDPLAEAQTFTEYVRVLDDSPLFLDDATEGVYGDLRSDEEQARRTIAGTWDLSLALLERQGTGHSRGLLQLLSCFAPAVPLPNSLLNPSTVAGLGMWPEELAPRTIRKTLGGLRRFGLIGVDTLSAEPAYQIHRLVAEVSVAPLLSEPRGYQEVWDSAADLLVAATPHAENPRDPRSWPAWQDLVPHWLVLLSRLPRSNAPADDRLTDVLLCAGVAVSYLHFRGEYGTACKFADEALERSISAAANPWIGVNLQRHRAIAVKEMGDLKAAEFELDRIAKECIKRFGEADPTTLSIRYERARVASQRGKLAEAEHEYDEVIRQETRLFGAEADKTLRSRHARAICIRSMGRLDDAAAEGRVVLEGLRAELGEKHPDVLEAQHEFAISLRDQGDVERAEEVFRQVLQLEEEALGAEHPSTLITRANLASALVLRQKFAEAEAEIRTVLDARTRILGPDHPETLDARHILAVLQMRHGELDAKSAAAIFAELTDAQRRQLIDDHPNVLIGRDSHAAALRSMGELTQSESEYRSILEAATARHGTRHPVTLNARLAWAMALGRIGRTNDAVSEMREVLNLQQHVLGESHRNVASIRASLGALLLQQGSLSEAEKQLQHALSMLPQNDGQRLDIQHDLLAVLHARGRAPEAIDQLREIVREELRRSGPAHTDTVSARNTLGVALKDCGKLEEAEEVYREALRGAASKHSGDEPLMLTVRHNLAVVLRIQGNLEEAEKEQSAILAIQERRVGLEHPQSFATRLSLARILDDRGAAAEAEVAYRDLLSGCTRAMGCNHPQTLSIWGNLAFLLAGQERFGEAEEEYRNALDGCLATFGDDHPETLTMNHNLAMVLGNKGNISEAITRFRDVANRRARILGSDHADTLMARKNLGESLSRVNQPVESAEHFKEVADGWAHTRGADHDSVWDLRYRRAQLLWEAGQPRAAQDELEALLDLAQKAGLDGDRRVITLQRVLMAVRADDGDS